MKDISLKELLEAGCHFGHQVPRWNPKAASFIYTNRDGIHIIDLAKTKVGLEAASVFIKETASEGKQVVFVGTKRQARSIVEEESKRVGLLYLVSRWPGGLLTNWEQIKKNLDRLNQMRLEKKTDAWQKFTKKEQGLLGKELGKLEHLYGGIAALSGLPAVLVLVDIKKEDSAVREALKTGVRTIAFVDTNTNPDQIDYPIPANDDALGSIKLIISVLADAYEEGKEIGEKKEDGQEKKTEPAKKTESKPAVRVEEKKVKKPSKVKKSEKPIK